MATDTQPALSLPGHVQHRNLRREGELQKALAVAERDAQAAPTDRRAWARLAHVAFLVQQPAAVDRALTRLVELARSKGRLKDAVRLILRRASLLASAGGKPAPVVRQALAMAQATGDLVGDFLARQVQAVLAVQGGSPAEASGALTDLLRASLQANREADALFAVSRLAVGSGPGAGAACKMLALRATSHGEHDIAQRWFEEARRRLPGDVDLEREVEKLALATNNWKELAAIYTSRVEREIGPTKIEALQQLAELRESELSDPQGALEAYETALAMDLGLGTLREVFRLSALFGTLGYEVERWKRLAPGRMAEGADALERVAHSDLPPSARVRILETLAAVSRDELGEATRAEDALNRAESLRLLARRK